jgi:RNA-directed DNA polymerase
LSPLIFNIALGALDEHLMGPWKTGGAMSTESRRAARRRKGLPNWKAVRYADDFAVLVHGSEQDAEALREQIARVLAMLGLRLSESKTGVVHLSEGFSFLGFRLQWRRKRGTAKWYVYTFIGNRPIRSLKGQDSCPDPQDITAGPGLRADQAEPGHARLGQLLPARGRQEHLRHAG